MNSNFKVKVQAQRDTIKYNVDVNDIDHNIDNKITNKIVETYKFKFDHGKNYYLFRFYLNMICKYETF